MWQFEPIDHWPRAFTVNRKPAPFRASREKTESLLRYELRKIGAVSVAIQIGCDEIDFRRDGQLRAHASLKHPGVILSASIKGKPVSFPCDKYDSWVDNLRAIALSLEALRRVDRYGVTRSGEQYTGWAQLPGPSGDALPFADAKEASQWLAFQIEGAVTAGYTSALLGSPRELEYVRRELAKKLHPDRGGDAKTFTLMEKAVAMIDAHQKRS